ncbi:MAG: hypothetical protein LAP61_11295 [Acidobacteriia bacterium]|nr:hypothetical protein [Terriglobia bacterium]
MRKLVLLLALLLPLKRVNADDLTRLQIHVTNERGKPVDRATVIVKFVSGRSLKALGLKKARLSWELKSTQEGMAKIPGIPKGKILIQINAKNYQTFGDTFDIDEDERVVDIVLKDPQSQYSAHDH